LIDTDFTLVYQDYGLKLLDGFGHWILDAVTLPINFWYKHNLR